MVDDTPTALPLPPRTVQAAAGSSAPDSAASAAGERVAVITGTRLCIRCGFNLTGQTVLRDPVYSLLIARCPECGTVAPLQEYPPLGAWQRRWAIMLAVLWFAAMLLLAYGTAMIAPNTARLVSWQMKPRLVLHIADAWHPTLTAAIAAILANDGSADALPPNIVAIAQQYATYRDSAQYSEEVMDQWIRQGAVGIDPDWWKANRSAILASAPARDWEWLRRIPLATWSLRFLAAALLGALWAVLLLHLRRRARLAFGILILAVSAAIMTYSRPQVAATAAWIGWQMNATTIAQHEAWFEAAAAGLILFAVPFFLGLIFGRPLVRLLARALLPPRACQAIAPLWFCDGRTPPRVRIDPRRRGRSS